jgi:hypothetical protein
MVVHIREDAESTQKSAAPRHGSDLVEWSSAQTGSRGTGARCLAVVPAFEVTWSGREGATGNVETCSSTRRRGPGWPATPPRARRDRTDATRYGWLKTCRMAIARNRRSPGHTVCHP